MIDLWYKTAVIYALEVDSFQDSDADGVGDFEGLAHRLDYLAGLGVNCLWLLPFYPSPNRDNGYDVMDYYGVDSRVGTLGDFVEFTHQARERGMRVMIDLVVNHTSDQHPWFQKARRERGSRYRDYYIWSEEEPEHRHTGMVFPGHQEATWSYDEIAGAWYFHRFYRHQPDLNIANPEVREEIQRIMGFWLELGVSGFRLDAVPFLIEQENIADGGDPFEFLRGLRDFLSWRRGDAILLAEANVPPDDVTQYFGDGDRMHMLFNFLANQDLFLALATRSAEPLARAFAEIPSPGRLGQWANFLRNHDELDLGRLSAEEREAVYGAFAPDESMRIYGRGIRRRLAPMLDGDQRRIRLAHSLALSLPGTPILRYGEEIGMGDDLSLPERNSVRTPMQWSEERNAGFSDASSDRLMRPVISDGPFGYHRVNVADQHRRRDSLLTWMQQAIRSRRECPEFGWGEASVVETGDRQVFAHRCAWRGTGAVAVHNLGEEPREVTIDLGADRDARLVDLFSDREYACGEVARKPIEIDGYGYRWFRLERERN